MSWEALDHLLFITALATIYLLKDWRQVLILVTAFTIGHSLTLALSVLDIIRFPSNWVEFLIPCTIVVTAISNLFQKKFTPKSIRINYFLADWPARRPALTEAGRRSRWDGPGTCSR